MCFLCFSHLVFSFRVVCPLFILFPLHFMSSHVIFFPFPHFVAFCILSSFPPLSPSLLSPLLLSSPLLSSPRGCWWKSAVFKAWAESSRSQTGLCEWKVNGWPLNIYIGSVGGGGWARVAVVCSFKWAFEDASLSCLCVCLHWWETEAVSEALHYLLSGLVCTFSFIRFVYVCAVGWALWRRLLFTPVCECHHVVLVCTDVAFTCMLVSWSVCVYVLSHNLIIISCSQWQTDRETDWG